MSTSIDPSSYIATVRTAVWPTDPDEADQAAEDKTSGSADFIETLATIGQDVTAAVGANSKTRRFLAWAIALGVEPPGRHMEVLAGGVSSTVEEVEQDLLEVRQILESREQPCEVVMELVREISGDVFSKRSKVQRLLNWLFILRSSGPEFPTFQSIGQYCGVTRQAAHKDVSQIYRSYPYLKVSAETPHSKTNRRNTKLKDEE